MNRAVSVKCLNLENRPVDLDDCEILPLPKRDVAPRLLPTGQLSSGTLSSLGVLERWIGERYRMVFDGCQPSLLAIRRTKRDGFAFAEATKGFGLPRGRTPQLYVQLSTESLADFLRESRMAALIPKWAKAVGNPNRRQIDAYRALRSGVTTQKQLALHFGVDQGTISRWVRVVDLWIADGNTLDMVAIERSNRRKSGNRE